MTNTTKIAACTGTRKMRNFKYLEHLDFFLEGFKGFDEYRSGGAYGLDTLFAIAVAKKFGSEKLHLVVPKEKEWNYELITSLEPGNITIVEGDYMDRNKALVEGIESLLAFPNSYKEINRSGTWATVRRAKMQNALIYLYDWKEWDLNSPPLMFKDG